MKHALMFVSALALSLTYTCGAAEVAPPVSRLVMPPEKTATVSTPSPVFKDAFNKQVPLCKPGSVTALLGCTESTQKACRIATRMLDEMRGMKNLRVVVIVDLRNSIGGFLPGFVRDRMQSDLKTESGRLRAFYAKNGNPGDPLEDVAAVPDFDGKICHLVGWDSSLKKLCAVVYNGECKEVQRWSDLQNYSEFQQAVKKALGVVVEPIDTVP